MTDLHCWISPRIAERKVPANVAFSLLSFLLSFSSQSIIKCCIKPGTGRVTFYFPGVKRIGLRPPLPEELPLKETQFSLKKADWSATLSHRPSLSLLFSFSLLLCPLSCSPSLDKGRLHKSVTQEIPTLYFLSDKEPVMGDEFVAAGGFDRLWGNNKAISACQKSQRKGRERETHTHTHGRYKSLVRWPQFFGGEMRQLNCTERWVAWPERSRGSESIQWPNKDVL